MTNAGSACPQCGSIANPNDKFCNSCGTRLVAPNVAPPAGQPAPQYGAPPPPQGAAAPQPSQGAYGAPSAAKPPPQAQGGPQYVQTPYPAQVPGGMQGQMQNPMQNPMQGQGSMPGPGMQGAQPSNRPSRCQMGHEIAPGMSYCAQGHPIALDAMQFASDPSVAATAYSPGQGFNVPQGYAPPPAPAPMAPPQPAQGFGFGPPQQAAPAYAPQPAPQGYAPAPQAYGAPQPPLYGSPQGYAPPQGQPHPAFQPAPIAPPGAPQGYAPVPGQSNDTSPDRGPSAAVNVRQLRAFLVSFQANAQGDFWPLYTGRVTVGRANAGEPADIPLADATISSRHAAIVLDMNAVVVEDTSSTNGTYVNEEHIGANGRRELRDGDRLRFGGFTTLVKILGRP